MTGTTLVKCRSDAPEGFFEAEAAGLEWLASAGGARTAPVIDVAPGRIELERITVTRPAASAAREFGRALAVTHAAGAAAFGAAPDGYTGQLFIGARPMSTADETSWGRFYVRHRVLPFLDIAVAVGTVDERARRIIREACDRVECGDFDDQDPPARIHGDLWNGNVLWSERGVVLIDPAAHGGHRETDLAMLALFGCPFLGDVLRGYDDASPLRTDWRRRVPVHQLHPLAVHAAGHGPSYGSALREAADAVLAL